MQTYTYIDELVEIYVEVINENSTSAFNYLDDFRTCECPEVARRGEMVRLGID